MPKKPLKRATRGGFSFEFNSERVRRHAPLFFAGLITLLIAALYLDNHRVIATWELGIQDKMISLGKKTEQPKDVVICTIDDSAVEKLGAWPWDAERVGYLVGMLSEYKPRAIGLDFQLGEDATLDPVGNYFLAEMIKRAGNVVLPLRFTISNDPHAPVDLPKSVVKSSMVTIDQAMNLMDYPYPVAMRVDYPYEEASDAAWGLGQTNTWQDVDGKVRRDPMVVKFQGEYYPSMALQLARCATGAYRTQVKINPGEGITFESQRVPTDNAGLFLIDYLGSAGTVPRVSAARVLEGEPVEDAIAGKIVVVGVTARGYGTELNTPTSEQMPRSEKIAMTASNILAQQYIKPVQLSSFLNLLILFGIGAACGLLLPRVPLLYRAAILAVVAFLFIDLNFFLYSSFHVITNTIYPSLQILLFLAASPFMRSWSGESDSKTLTDALKRRKKEGKTGTKPEPALESAPTVAMSTEGSGSVPTRVVKEDQPVGAIDGLEKTALMNSDGILEETPQPSDLMGSDPKPLGPDMSTSASMAVKADEPMDFSGKRLGRYELLGVLGQGAMGTVYKGKDPAIDRLVALKTIRAGVGQDEEQARELRERLVREAKAAGKLSHPNIVTIYDVGAEGELNYIAMEYLEGYTLEQVIKRKVQLNYRIVAKIITQVCAALDYAHKAGIVHRDVKPANIMVLNDFKIKVTDFGIARFDSPQMSMTQTGIAMGTPHYISPEQLRGGTVDRRCDIFSLGVVTYELLTRTRPFSGENISALIYSITQTDPKPPSSLDENIPGIFDMVVSKALAKDPLARYQTAEQMAQDLKVFEDAAAPSYQV